MAKLSAEHGIALGNAGGFKSVNTSFMENNAAKAAVDNDRDCACRAFGSVQHGDSDFCALPANILHIDALKGFKAHAEAGAYRTGLSFAVCHGNGLNIYPRTGTTILCPDTVAVADHDAVVTVHIACNDLSDFIGIGLCSLGAVAQQGDTPVIADL